MDFSEYHLCYLLNKPKRHRLPGIRVLSRGLLEDGLCLDVITGTRNNTPAIAFALKGINGHM
ncbi:hypothetical protein D3C74_432630 [compost metagenome]